MEYLAVSILDILCVIMPRWAEPRRHTVVGLCVCVCVLCVCVCVCVCVSVQGTLTKRQRVRC